MAELFKQRIVTEAIKMEAPSRIKEKPESFIKTKERLKNIMFYPEMEVKEEIDTEPTVEPITETSVEQVINQVFDNINEVPVEYDVNVPIIPKKIATESVSQESIAPVNAYADNNEISEVNDTNIEEMATLTDKLKLAIAEENEEKNKAEEARIKYESSVEELRKTRKEYSEEMNKLKTRIEESNKRKNQYKETIDEMDRKTADTIGETESYREKISYIRSLASSENQADYENDGQVLRRIA